MLETGRKFLPQQLAPETYKQMFEVLLWCEEFKISYAFTIDTSRYHHGVNVHTGEISRNLTCQMLESNAGTICICPYFHLPDEIKKLMDFIAFLSLVWRRNAPVC